MKPTRRSLFSLTAVALASLVCSCHLDRGGMVMVTDPAYRAKLVATHADGLDTPDGILWHEGKLILADEGAGSLRAWGATGGFTTLCDSTTGIHEPEDLVADRQGNVFFTDDGAGGVWEIDHHGRVFLLAGRDQGLPSTEGIALTPSGDILVGDGKRRQVFSVDRAGKVSVFLGRRYGITKTESMVFGEQGELYIADNVDKVVYLLTPRMKLLRLLEKRDGFSPETIWYADEMLYITDSENGKLWRYTPEKGLETIAVFGGSLGHVAGVTTDESGDIFVSIPDLASGMGYIIKLEREQDS
ncbi:MAG TPA: hypothetical protein VF247_01870 [Candidatus Krumholzibacteria bacterium]